MSCSIRAHCVLTLLVFGRLWSQDRDVHARPMHSCAVAKLGLHPKELAGAAAFDPTFG
jgi:hypothetical protein